MTIRCDGKTHNLGVSLHEYSLPQDSTSNAVGSAVNICYESACATPTPSPTLSPSPTAAPTTSSPPSPTPTPLSCPVGSAAMGRYRVSAAGMPDTLLDAVETATTVEDFYRYSGSQNGAAREVIVSNASTIAVHRDVNNDEYSLLLLNGPPLMAGDNYVQMDVEVSRLPATAIMAVTDDPATDSFSYSPTTGTITANWAWKQPYSDGIAIRMPKEKFCVDITILSNTYPTEWKFYSRNKILSDTSVRTSTTTQSLALIPLSPLSPPPTHPLFRLFLLPVQPHYL